jgi:hypothetical protein
VILEQTFLEWVYFEPIPLLVDISLPRSLLLEHIIVFSELYEVALCRYREAAKAHGEGQRTEE